MTFKTIIESNPQPKVVHKASNGLYILVRDDTADNGKLYVAPIGAQTSMVSITPERFKEEFDWYVEPADRPVIQAMREIGPENPEPLTKASVEKGALRNKGGRPRGSKDKAKRRAKRPIAQVESPE